MTPLQSTPPNDLTYGIYSAINAVRAGHGRAPLAHDGRLTLLVSRPFAAELAERGLALTSVLRGAINHDRASGIGFAAAIRETLGTSAAEGEVVLAGTDSPAAAVAAWAADPAHLAELLGPFTTIGAGVAFAGDGTPYWVADFAG